MKLLVTSDLHYGLSSAGDNSTHELAAKAIELQPDALVIAGDIGRADCDGVSECLSLFHRFRGLKLAVAGNHDLWTKNDWGSDKILEDRLPDLCIEQGFHLLDTGPAYLGDLAFVGGVGWYDYSFRDESYQFPVEYYQNKVLPGVVGWNDGVYVKWRYSDPEFCEKCLCRLDQDLKAATARATRMVTCIHHVPFASLVKSKGNPSWDFNNAFMGSQRFGELLLNYTQVELCIFGHTHSPVDDRVDSLMVLNPGSDYRVKRFSLLEL